MELDLLRTIQDLHCGWLNPLMIFFSNLTNHGEIWIALTMLLLCFKKTRKCGITMGVSLLLMLVCGNLVLKNVFSRVRPCWADQTVAMLIERPTSFSFPSGHTFSSFASAFTILMYEKRAGIAAMILAAVIAFSRMYLFVHYPTDILAGILFGFLTAAVSYQIVKRFWHTKQEA